jgi:hypothetical protein
VEVAAIVVATVEVRIRHSEYRDTPAAMLVFPVELVDLVQAVEALEAQARTVVQAVRQQVGARDTMFLSVTLTVPSRRVGRVALKTIMSNALTGPAQQQHTLETADEVVAVVGPTMLVKMAALAS